MKYVYYAYICTYVCISRIYHYICDMLFKIGQSMSISGKPKVIFIAIYLKMTRIRLYPPKNFLLKFCFICLLRLIHQLPWYFTRTSRNRKKEFHKKSEKIRRSNTIESMLFIYIVNINSPYNLAGSYTVLGAIVAFITKL